MNPQSTKTDHTLPQGKWTFDGDVTDVFDDMLRRSIPQYEVMRKAVFDIARRFVQPLTDIVDLGCSRGESLAPYIALLGGQNRYVGVDVSEPMLNAARDRFKAMIDAGLVKVLNLDLRQAYPAVSASLTLSVLTVQFVPIEHRARLLAEVYKHSVPGGAFVLVEKILGGTAAIDETLVDAYYTMKRENGYSQEEIDRKRLALEGVLVPVTAKWNEELLARAGFDQVECFWRWMNFAGWVAVKTN